MMSGTSVLAPTTEVIYWTKFTYDQNNYPIYGGIQAVLTGTGIGTVRVALYRDVGAGNLVLSGVSSSRTVSAGSLAIFPDGAEFVADGRLASGSWALALYVQANNLVPLTGAIAVPVGWTSPPWCGDQFPTFFSPVLTSVGTQIDLFMEGCRPGTFTPTRTPSFTCSPTPTKTPTQSLSPSPTSCGPCTASATPTRTGVVSATCTPSPTVTPTVSPTSTHTRSATPTRTYVAVCVPPTASTTPTATPTDCAACTATFSPTLTVTKTPTRTPTCVPHSSGGDIGIRVFDDANGNGVRDGGEALMSGVTVTGYHVEPCMGGLTVTGWETLPLSGTYIVATYAGAPTSITVNLAGGGLPVLPLITTADPLVAFSSATNRYLNGEPIPYYDIGVRSGASPTPTPTDCAACSPTVSPTMSATPSATITLSSSPSETLTISPTMTRSPSGSPSATVSPTPTPTCACLYSPTPTPSTTFAIPTYAPPPPGSTGTYAYPVPAHGSVNFVVSSAQAAQAHVEVVTSAGSAVSTLDQALPAGGDTVVVDLRGFAPGIYFYMVRLTFADGTSQNLAPKAFAVTP